MSTPMEVLPVDSEGTYHSYLEEIAALSENDPPVTSPEGERLLALVNVVETYEKARWPDLAGDCDTCD